MTNFDNKFSLLLFLLVFTPLLKPILHMFCSLYKRQRKLLYSNDETTRNKTLGLAIQNKRELKFDFFKFL